MISMVLGESNINNINIDGPSHQSKKLDLVGGLKHLDHFSIQLGMSSSQLTFIFFRGVDQPPTSDESSFPKYGRCCNDESQNFQVT